MDLNNIKGIGEKTQKLFNKIGVFSVEDLLTYYPYRYIFYNIHNINNCKKGETINAYGTIESTGKVSYIKRNFNMLSFTCLINNNIINVKIFNRAFYKNNIVVGKEITLIGKYDSLHNSFIANNIIFNKIDNNKIDPVYHLIKGLNNNVIKKAILSLKDYNIKDEIPLELNERYNFINKSEAIRIIHNPKNIEELKKAKLKLIYDELYEFSYKMNYLKYIRINEENGISKEYDIKKIEEIIKKLPYKLTLDQEQSIKDILSDLKSNKRMNRILIGDVGSGKTIVSFIAMYANFLAGYQSAFLAPTEILAHQHYENFKNIFPDLNIELLTGKITNKEKNIIKQRIKNNEVNFVIGTHALLTDDVVFNKLGLIITDEQHRFGVNQRLKLSNKGFNTDVLYMSATPIPRTYALALYGDMDVSIIKTKPIGRKDVLTEVVSNKDIKKVLNEVKNEVLLNHQIFVVAPLIENEDSDVYSVYDLKNKFDIAFNKKININIIHGSMNKDEKETIMNNFKNKKIQILISTTVIEVGVDIPNASMIIVFNSELFGLATLHQLRGRVGRSDIKSKCFLISDSDTKRLQILKESNDGFYISEQDFKLRREGDLFGTKQSGDMSFKIADIKRDYKIFEKTKEDSWENILNTNKIIKKL